MAFYLEQVCSIKAGGSDTNENLGASRLWPLGDVAEFQVFDSAKFADVNSFHKDVGQAVSLPG